MTEASQASYYWKQVFFVAVCLIALFSYNTYIHGNYALKTDYYNCGNKRLHTTWANGIKTECVQDVDSVKQHFNANKIILEKALADASEKVCFEQVSCMIILSKCFLQCGLALSCRSMCKKWNFQVRVLYWVQLCKQWICNVLFTKKSLETSLGRLHCF